ncbi:DUF5957 family protein [Parageobacillus toebii]|uniref:DUF5957 family protein n=1 Tax=Parageobacillus toebii TaxID=153151 RepID=UPI001967F344|nr:DUF5957 family protein [Parageobacillus toebii]QSB49039.1 hypothetical protein JTI59_01400 [Parageobacillus toebii]
MKKIFLAIIIAVVAGFIGGIVLSEIIAITAHFLFDRPIWIRWVKYLPIYLAVLSAVVTFIALWRKQI